MTSSLYGGPAGSSMIIKAWYPSVQAMVDAFKQGPSYTVCGYGEYCIIDTSNKNDADNGIIYQRGVNYNDDMGGAIRIGQVVGPSSGTPYFQLASVQAIKNIAEKHILEADNNGDTGYVRYPIGANSDGTYEVAALTAEQALANGTPDIFVDSFGDDSIEQAAMIPGYNHTTNEFRDDIRYTWCNVRLDDADADSWFYIGVELPYLVTDYNVTSVSPYDEDGNYKDTTSVGKDKSQLKTVIEDGKEVTLDEWLHPFYNLWNLGIPKGIKGDTLRNLKVIDAANRPAGYGKIYLWEAFTADKANDYKLTLVDDSKVYECGHSDVEGQRRDIIVFDVLAYDNKADASDKTYHIYLGDYNMVENINLAADGKLTIKYTHDDEATNADGSAFPQIRWIESIEIANDGHFVATYNNPINQKNQPSWLASDPNKDKKQGYQLDWIKDILINEENGAIGLVHANKDLNTDKIFAVNDAKKVAARLKLLTKADTDKTGKVTLHFNTGEDDNIVIEDAEHGGDYHLRIIEDSKINTGINEDKRIQLTFNSPLLEGQAKSEKVPGKDNTYFIGNPINDIAKVVVRPYDWHMFVLYSDPTHRFSPVPSDTNIGSDPNDPQYQIPTNNDAANNWIRRTYIADVQGYKYQAKDGTIWWTNIEDIKETGVNSAGLYWQDMGSVKDEAGLLVGMNLTSDDIDAAYVKDGAPDVIGYLNFKYPTGLTALSNTADAAPLIGKMVTYANKITGEKKFYAFNYGYVNGTTTPQGWFYLGSLGKTTERDIVYYPQTWVYPPQPNMKQLVEQVNMVAENGIAIISRPVEITKEKFPRYWAPDYMEIV